jgi:hypothetical protein
MDMLDEGTTRRTSLQISDELAGLGASLSLVRAGFLQCQLVHAYGNS